MNGFTVSARQDERMPDTPTYSRDSRYSYFRDLAMCMRGVADEGARERLDRHALDIQAKRLDRRALDIQATGADDDAWPVPKYLLDRADEWGAPARRYADVVINQPLPGGTDSINIPRVTGVCDDPSKYINAPVRRIAGRQGVHTKLLDDNPVIFDQILMRDLVFDHAGNLNRQIIFGTGTNNQLLGTRHNIARNGLPAGQSSAVVHDAIGRAARDISQTRYLPADVIMMHPRRWLVFLSALGADKLKDEVRKNDRSAELGAVGYLRFQSNPDADPVDIPVIPDSDMIDGEHDFIHVMRSADPVLWQSGLRARCELDPENDKVVIFELISDAAFTAQRYASIIEVSGPALAAPQL